MRLTDRYPGADDPFEGDRMLTLRSLPAGASVTKATITLTPAPSGAAGFLETFVFGAPSGNQLPASSWGVTSTGSGPFVEVDFHARRMLASLAGTGGAATLQVDMGGTFIGIAQDGTFSAPGKTDLPVNLSTTAQALPGLVTGRFRVTRAGATGSLDVTQVTVRSLPSNVTVRLGKLPPFWTVAGDLAVPATSPDFAAVLNASLLDAKLQDGFYALPMVIHTDTVARFDVDIAIDFVIGQAVLPAYLPQATLPFGLSTLPGADESITTVLLPRQAVPVAGQNAGLVQGQFQPTRVAQGPVGEEPPAVPAAVSPDCSLAQMLSPGLAVQLTGVDLPLGTTTPGLAGLNVSVQADDDGKPSGTVLAAADVSVGQPLPGQSSWGSATLPVPFRIEAGRMYWLVLQSREGAAAWNATTGQAVPPAAPQPPLQCSRDGGLSWRTATAPGALGTLSALLRLRHQPDRFTIPVQLQIGKGPGAVRRRLDEFGPLGRVEFTFDFTAKLREHLAGQAQAAPCGTGNLLANGAFGDPAPGDATRRLFGIDAGSAVPVSSAAVAEINGTVDLGGGVDLSVERYIMLQIDDNPPRRIDCAGRDPAHTSLEEIITAINRGSGVSSPVASEIEVQQP